MGDSQVPALVQEFPCSVRELAQLLFRAEGGLFLPFLILSLDDLPLSAEAAKVSG